VNFKGFTQLVNNLGGVWLDHRSPLLCVPTNCPGVSKINLLPGYSGECLERPRLRAVPPLRLGSLPNAGTALPEGDEATDLIAAGLNTVFKIMNAVETERGRVGRGGGQALDPKTLRTTSTSRRIAGGHVSSRRSKV